jgi:hypothetical protein
MGFADVWNRTLVYFGIAEEDDWDEEGYVTDEDLQRTYAERPNVRRLAPRRRERGFDDWTDPEPDSDHRTAVMRARPRTVAADSRRAGVSERPAGGAGMASNGIASDASAQAV